MRSASSLSDEVLARFMQHPPSGLPGQTVADCFPGYIALLKKLGSPETQLPPVIHVAGTNGKGSTCAFLRAILEAAGKRVHVFTSPHLVAFTERIRIAGHLISDDELAELLLVCEQAAPAGAVSLFEASTAAAFLAFRRHPADFTILETGLGGRLDATNVVPRPLATVITRISYDHREYLGSSLAAIATEKAGIMRPGVPLFTAAQPDREVRDVLAQAAKSIGAPLLMGGDSWHVDALEAGFRFRNPSLSIACPAPSLPGAHQYQNAGLAISALLGSGALSGCDTTEDAIRTGVLAADWPARLQLITSGPLLPLLAEGSELWLDGGHNDSAGEVLAAQAAVWAGERRDLPLRVIYGMLKTKVPEEFLGPLRPHIAEIVTVDLPSDVTGFGADELAQRVSAMGPMAVSAASVLEALQIFASRGPSRVLICGSLYLAGDVLRLNGVTVADRTRG